MKTCIKNVNLIDGTGAGIQHSVSLLMENDEILSVLNGDAHISDDFKIIDLTGKYIIPGLIDCHTHICLSPVADTFSLLKVFKETDYVIAAVKHLESFLKNGVTTIRDLGGVKHLELPLRRYLKEGVIQGPDMLCAGKLVTMTGGHGWVIGREADGPDEVRKAVREQLKAGVDCIKVISSGGVLTPGVDVNAFQFNVDELRAAVEEAHKAGKRVATHCHSTQGIKNSILAGIDSIEHATLLDDEGIQMLVDSGTYIVPTFSAIYNILTKGKGNGIPEYAIKKTKEVMVNHAEGFQKAVKAGVNIAMGTDAGTPFNKHGESAKMELILMVKNGLSEMDAIVSATGKSAELLGISDCYGTLQKGKKANFIVLKDNPLENISSVNNMLTVYKNGCEVNM